MKLISDAVLLRDTRPATELRRALKAGTICRVAHLRGLGRFVKMADALEAIAAADAQHARDETMARELLAEILERVVPVHATVDNGDGCGFADPEVEMLPTDAREAARDVIGRMQGVVARIWPVALQPGPP